ncbi:MAG TPA: septal ring lytic transglycosylase RlpA family protein [Caulobacteraceae bacterium]|nr:septal ring lytic transglycosylase RlpA family protein [Caulobacteraceae bacterium]
MRRRLLAAVLACGALAACASTPPEPPPQTVSGTMKPYTIRGKTYTPRHDPDYDEVGLASWYGGKHHGRMTADGEIFDQNAPSAAHKTLPLPSVVEVKNLENGRKIKVRVNDRGPFAEGRIIDLSKEAARQLGMLEQGLAKVRVRYVGPAERKVARR